MTPMLEINKIYILQIFLPIFLLTIPFYPILLYFIHRNLYKNRYTPTLNNTDQLIDMYWIIDGLCFLLGIAYFILSFLYNFPFTCWVGIIWIIIYPLLLEAIYNLIGYCSKKV